MKSTTVRLDLAAKARLDHIQVEWQRRMGALPTQQDLLGKALEYAEADIVRFIDATAMRPWTREQIEQFFTDLPPDVGDPKRSVVDDIDEVVYGHDAWERKMGRA